jgi:hypothetical protein
MGNPGPELFKAMLAFQSTNPRVAKSGDNPHFRSKYITLEDLTSVARECNKHGLVFYQYLDGGADGSDFCVTTVAHAESGQYVEARVRLLYGKLNPQGQGSAATYARRYGLGALLALCETEDDDANAAMESTGMSFQRDQRTGKGQWSPPQETNVPFEDLRTPKEKARLAEMERKAKHHESWQEARGAFMARLTMDLGLDYYEVAAWMESKGNPRPTGMTDSQRRKLLDMLQTEGGRNLFLNWKEER